MEYLDIVTEDGIPTGVTKERNSVHRDGDLHRTSHVWIAREDQEHGMEILLQKRSMNKDSHPGCYDISSAGHIPAGMGYLESALRELMEELGVHAEPEELIDKGLRRVRWQETFHGRIFRDNQVSRVYLLWKDVDISKLCLQTEEVESVCWMEYAKCFREVQENSMPNCIALEELRMLKQ
ncbi:NUDIX domain-containing protein [Ruminococcus sp. OA3]|uniref:NUDIX hydrolase n=1 Tax=Ruminococcus sp. OA3 TaxID=2914164 RepID=UPI001F055D7D|nr:NUDIX domain-containing protein [Ruminococcus sp. OA3]MCH1981371.1 NUDIX domain-containing protein [Ruminococcus sp. OA3]